LPSVFSSPRGGISRASLMVPKSGTIGAPLAIDENIHHFAPYAV
jgi:hypothetical protein